jgi:peroxiredoxin
MRKAASIVTVFALLFIFTLTLSNHLSADEKETLKKAGELIKQEKYVNALKLIDEGLRTYGETAALMAAKAETLVKLNRLDEALTAAIKRAEVSERKSPWHCIDIVSICVRLKKTDAAFEWLNKAVERGFLSYSELLTEEFAVLKEDERFPAVIDTIKMKIGIGKPAKDFTVKLLTNESFVLSKQKGKVILIDFWATWCPPCVKGIPYLKKYYAAYKDKGLEIIGISLDSKVKAAQDYIAEKQLTWKMACSGKAWSDDIARFYNVNLIPSYWLIDRQGILRDFGIHLRDKETMKKAIEKLVLQ